MPPFLRAAFAIVGVLLIAILSVPGTVSSPAGGVDVCCHEASSGEADEVSVADFGEPALAGSRRAAAATCMLAGLGRDGSGWMPASILLPEGPRTRLDRPPEVA